MTESPHSTPDPPADAAPGPPPRLIALDGRHGGARLDLFLAAELSLSRGQVRRLLEAGSIRLDDRVLGLADKGREVPESGAIAVAAWRAPGDQQIHAEAASSPAPAVLAEGPGWVAIDKPAGMPVHPLREDEGGTVLGHVAARWPGVRGVGEGGLRSGVVHRLDVETSGVLLVATEEAAWQRLRGAFQRHEVLKRYRAIVAGRVETPDAGLAVELPLVVAKHRPAYVRVATDEELRRGRARVIRQTLRAIEPLGREGQATLVEVRPATGFLHQIRATLTHLGHPLLGDRRYADEATAALAPRHMLHASRVQLDEIEAEAPDAPDFEACLASLRR